MKTSLTIAENRFRKGAGIQADFKTMTEGGLQAIHSVMGLNTLNLSGGLSFLKNNNIAE